MAKGSPPVYSPELQRTLLVFVLGTLFTVVVKQSVKKRISCAIVAAMFEIIEQTWPQDRAMSPSCSTFVANTSTFSTISFNRKTKVAMPKSEGRSDFVKLGGGGGMKFVAGPLREDEEADEDADGEAHSDGAETLASQLHDLVGADAGNHHQIECEDEDHHSIVVLPFDPRHQPRVRRRRTCTISGIHI
nr:hypothetical protein Iba_chr07bCG1010 [Ipomoea batatas]